MVAVVEVDTIEALATAADIAATMAEGTATTTEADMETIIWETMEITAITATTIITATMEIILALLD